MWFSFWRSRDRFSLQELRYLTDQLQKVQIVNNVNKDHVIEVLRSIAELLIYGDQHDPTFFEFFIEKQIIGEFLRILDVSRTVSVALQLLQTMSIMIQNLKSEHAIYYIFNSEHINDLIGYSFDFGNEELLSYYITFLRAISGKLNKRTISLLVETQNDEVVSFPLYIEAIQFAFHEENMVRIAVRALTLNVYHVGDECVNRFVTSTLLADYFSNLVAYFRKQCISLDGCVSEAAENPDSSDLACFILSAVDEIEDTLYYCSDVISSGVPNIERLVTENILQLLVFPSLLPSLKLEPVDGMQIGASTSMYLLCCILRIVKTKDLARSIGASLFCTPESVLPKLESRPNGYVSGHDLTHENHQPHPDALGMQAGGGSLRVSVLNFSSSDIHPAGCPLLQHDYSSPHLALRDILLSYVVSGDEIHVLGSLNLLATLLQTKELDESILDALGILPQRKHHKKLLLKALVGDVSGEERLFSEENSLTKDEISTELERYLQQLKVLDALVSLLCRSDISAETLWVGGWLLRQLLPCCEEGFNNNPLKPLKDSYICADGLLGEIRGSWCDLLISVLADEWSKCKKAIEASTPQKDPNRMLFPLGVPSVEGESTFAAGEGMCEIVKVFVLRHQIRIFCSGGALPDQPPVCPPSELPGHTRTKSGIDDGGPKPGSEINIVNAVACRIAFERGKEHHFCFSAISRGTTGWLVLAEESPLKKTRGFVRVSAPLAGSNPKIDDKHSRWLHLRIRPSTMPLMDPTKPNILGKGRTKCLIDGRWTLAFKDEISCKSAQSMVLEGMRLQSSEVERRLKPLLDLSGPTPDPVRIDPAVAIVK
ncbi:protein TRANSPARENT TESTA 9-like isoform X3 [Magnolia sinica]|uniref:protein TRANSPARENT TESTA 9-like isoform X3 n=1 Tax=Magnolia sinica TaxID=86752 RepID=UPI002658F488|nr:protein TRANSPARENT TESTA 9-like isoform X3 [Magnolia sinica]